MARRVHPLIRAVARSRPFARVGPRVLPRLDLPVSRLTGGRVVPVVAELPTDDHDLDAARAELTRSGAAPVYDEYAARSGRSMRLFRLTPV